MPRRAALVALLVAMVFVVAGCGSQGSSNEVLPTVKAPPQTAELGWLERYPADQPSLVFGVESFTVTDAGWRAVVSVQNRSDVSWKIEGSNREPELQFGVMLFPSGDHGEFDARNRALDLPAVRAATGFSPTLPSVLRPGTTWRGTMSAPGALAGGLWVRVTFGPFVSDGDPPRGSQTPVTWITDHAYHLQVVSAQPA